jgi:hypothetical protein
MPIRDRSDAPRGGNPPRPSLEPGRFG